MPRRLGCESTNPKPGTQIGADPIRAPLSFCPQCGLPTGLGTAADGQTCSGHYRELEGTVEATTPSPGSPSPFRDLRGDKA
jgi:hypothetical protein